MGGPPGSVIFSVMLHVIGRIVKHNALVVHMSLYADVLAIWEDYHQHRVGLLLGWRMRYQDRRCLFLRDIYG